MKATEILKTDHRILLALVDQAQRMKERNALLLQRLYDNLKVHTACEEQIFYPAVDGAGHTEEVVRFPQAEAELEGNLDDLGSQIDRLKIDLRTSDYGMAA